MKAKKLFSLSALLLTAAMVLSACGGSGTSAQTAAPAAPETGKEAPAQGGGNTPAPAPADAAPEVIYDENDITISVTPVATDEYGSDYTYNITAENKSSELRRVNLTDLVINGLQFPDYGAFYGEIEAGQSAEGKGFISKSELAAAGITEIGSAEASFIIMNDDYDTIAETGHLAIPVAGGSGSGSYDISGGQVILDADGVRLSYLGGSLWEGDPNSGSTLINLAFAIENGTDDVVALYDKYDSDIVVDGTVGAGDPFVNSSAPVVLQQMKAFGPVSVYVDSKDISTVDFSMQLQSMHESVPWYLIPMHITLNGNEVSFSSDAPEIDPGWAEGKALEESWAAEEEALQLAEQEAAEAVANAIDPEVMEIAFDTKGVGNNRYYSTDVIAMLHNPNDNLYFADIKVKFTLYDADGNVLGEEYNNTLSSRILGPGETMPFIKEVWRTDIEPASAEAVFESGEPMDLERGRYYIEENHYAHLSDNFSLDDVEIRAVQVFNITEYHISGHVTNSGEESGDVIMHLNFRGEDGTLLYGTDTRLKDVPANSGYDFDQVLGDHELPENANLEVFFIAQSPY